MGDDDPAHPPTSREPLGPAYHRLWASSGLSNLADGVFKVALPLTAVGLTQSPALVAGVTFALTLPWLLFALPAGALADRLDRRRVMLGANTARIGLLAALATAAVFDQGSIWMLYAIAFCVGTAETLYDTSAQSILPQLVPRQQLSRANGRLYAVELTANQFLGPPLGGALVAVGAVAAFATPAALWAVAAGALLLVRGRFRIIRDQHSTLRADIGEGLRFLWSHRILRALAVLVGTFNFATNALMAVFVLYAAAPGSPMGLSEPAYGLLLTATAAGGLLGSLVAERVERTLGRARSLVLTILAGALFVGTPALTTDPLVIGAVFFLGGATIVVGNVIMVSLRQRLTPDRLLGRVNGGYRLLAWGSIPLGAAVGGLLAQLVGIRAVFAAMVLVMLALLALMTVLTDRGMDAAERANPA